MTNKDEFELDVEETAEEEFDDVSLDEGVDSAEAAPPKKKKSGGGLMIFVLLLAVLGGGGFAAVKFLGVQLPFDVPGLTQTAQTPSEPAPTMSASADLPAGDLPPQPAADTSADAGGLPTGIPAATSPEEASINAPWGAEEVVDIAAESRRQMPAEPFGDAPAPSDAGNIVDPFAFGAQDVTAQVNEVPQAAPPAESEMIDPFASMAAQAPVTEVAPAPEPAPVPVAAPVAVTAAAPAEDAATKAQLTALEKKLAETQKSLEASEKALKKANDDLAKKSEELAKAQADLKVAQKTAKVAADKPAAAESKPAAVQTTKPATKPAAAPARKIEWVLRSAKPGMAWVSEKGSSEMRTVGVGDTLAGIGKVTAITTDAQGRWVVNGTRGAINQ